jgi:hypothetical protein
MKFTAKAGNNGVLTFNDLGTDIKGVSSQEKNLHLNPGASIYLPDQSGVLYSVTKGDAKRYADAGLLDINDTAVALANNGTIVMTHNFNVIPNVTVLKLVGGVTWDPVLAADVTIKTNAVAVGNQPPLTVTTVKNVSGGALTLQVRIS